MATGTVTIDKAYFETLLRRAQFHTSGVDFTTPVHLPTVTIPKTDHDSLLSAARQYDNLRRNLYRGGIAEHTLAILIKDDSNTTLIGESTIDADDGSPPQNPQTLRFSPEVSNGVGGSSPLQDYTFGRNANYTPRNGDLQARDNNTYQNKQQTNDDFTFMPDDPSDGVHEESIGNGGYRTKSVHQQYDKFCKRSILLSNLPEGTTHADVVDAVRGGMLLDIYLRTHDRAASVSFLEEAHAQEYFRHIKRHDLYIRGKRVDIRWNDRQFILPGHVANKVGIGATRNLVIMNRNPALSEEMIRDDLEHIHNLVVVRISFSGKHAYISTNSVHNAMFARTCMMSRATYKGSKIEWDEDECAAPVPKPQFRQENAAPKKKDDAPIANRFHLLNMDDSESGSLDDDEFDNSGITLSSVQSTALFVT